MNKKFFTLMAAALVTGSVAAQTYDAGTDFEYRLGQTGYTNIAGNKNPVLDPANGWLKTVTGAPWVKDVKQVEEGLWYQLEVNDDSTPIADVLIQERDTKTGKIYLRVVEKNENGKAPLTASLWKIKYTAEDGVSGGKFTFVNKETGYELSFDQTLAQDANVEYLSKGINEWNWYLNNNGAQVMGWTKLYSVYTDPADASKKLVMTLKKATSTIDNDAINGALKNNGYAVKTTTNADATVTSLVAVHIDALPSNPNDVDGLEIKPVVAAPFFMTKEDFNNRLDADGKGNFKFTVEEEDVIGADVLEQEYVAVQSLVADPSTTFGVPYANFNLSFQLKSDPTKYLQISTERYEEDKLPSVSPSVKVVADVKPGTTNNLLARTMFRATYFPTNDSLFIEPLNAGIMTDDEYNRGIAFASCKAANGFTVKGEETAAGSGIRYITSANSVVNAAVKDYDEKSVSFTITKLANGKNVITVAPASKDGFAVKASIEQKFSYLKRAELTYDKLNQIKNKEDKEYIVCNFAGKMQWDVPTDNQNYDNMPATMWTFGKKGNEQVIIENREFDMASGASVFDGQLYVKDGKYFIIDENYTGLADSKLNNREAYTIAEVTDKNALEKAEHGYYNAGGDLLVKKFTFELNDNLVSEHFLNVDDKFFVPSAEQSSSYEFVEVATVPFGNKVGNLPALSRKAYNVKVLDNTLVDNDKTWIYQLVESGRPTYYKAMTETEGDAAGLEKAVFFFKSDEIMGEDNTETYVLIKAETVSGTANTAVSQASLESTAKLAYDELDNIPSQPSTTFAIAPLDVQLYRDLTADKTVKFFLKRGAANEYLYEGNGNETFGFLGLTSEGVHQAEGYNPSMASFKVSDHAGIMPEFLFAVDTATVADGYWCDIHGYEVTDPCGHADPYKGYMTGRFLINMKNYGKDYKFESYDRLGFVEGIYQDGKLYILSNDPLKQDVTLASLKVAEEKGGVIDPAKLAKLTPVTLDSPYTFSLRLINRGDEENFFIESERAAAGSFTGGWIKVQNGCPVIARHTATTGSSEDHEGDKGDIDEIMRDAQIFTLSEGNDVPTSNDAIEAVSAVKVVTVEGGVQVLNAAGKTVTVANVLGQTVASTVVSSDNATISAPAGVVIVTVEGEAAVKAIVK
ncbi:DUF6383 domain-containing protein [Parabacteroides goldsteinii]|uniref:DUF6383 domain-containing protein n=1 Tax=Parabacteroides goldsteinii TaxID=328812 RepID=UPI001CCE4474|nr:DUF6383 domain-containing protein [Parabacteroides goldsteinii]UBD73018.1 DUF6383 domain-containing protein [Parabacteroides goldsteinii]